MKNDRNYLVKFLILMSFIYLSILPCFACDSGIGNLKVYVIDRSTGEVIEGAYVNIILNETEIEKRTNEYGYSYFTSLTPGNYDISVKADNYISDHIGAQVCENETKTIEIKLEKSPYPDEEDINIGDLKINPQYVCIDEDKRIYISIPIKLEEGNDIEFTVKFYLYDGDRWDYLGKEKRTLDEDDEKTFDVSYNYQADTFDKGLYEIKAEIEYNDVERTEYAHLIVKDCDEDEPKDEDKDEPTEDSNFKISSITLNPIYPILDEMNIVSVLIRPEKNIEKYQTIRVEAWIDGKPEKYENIDFGFMEFSKTFEFAFDTSHYGIGYHTITIFLITSDGISENKKTFQIFQKRPEYPTIIEAPQKHCLRVNSIDLLNAPVKKGGMSEISVIVENCGTYMERNIILELNYTGEILSDSFDLMRGKEKEIIFKLDNSKTKELTFKLWNGYNSLEKNYNLVTHKGILEIYFEPSYTLNKDKITIIQFTVKNIGVVRDKFRLNISDEFLNWTDGFPRVIELDGGEIRTIKFIIYPGIPSKVNSEINLKIIPLKYPIYENQSSDQETANNGSANGGMSILTGINQWSVLSNITVQKLVITTFVLLLLLIVVLLMWVLYKLLKDHRKHLEKEENARVIPADLKEEFVSVNSNR